MIILGPEILEFRKNYQSQGRPSYDDKTPSFKKIKLILNVHICQQQSRKICKGNSDRTFWSGNSFM